jgi:hypothetical protein
MFVPASRMSAATANVPLQPRRSFDLDMTSNPVMARDVHFVQGTPVRFAGLAMLFAILRRSRTGKRATKPKWSNR